MIHMIRLAAHEALLTLRSNTVHTLLSTLGIIIGVGALVSILSLGDGLEKFGREQVSLTTDLSSILVETITHDFVDGIRVPKETVPYFTLSDARALDSLFQGEAVWQMGCRFQSYLSLADDSLRKAAICEAGWVNSLPDTLPMLAGRIYGPADFARRDSVVVLSRKLAHNFNPQNPEELLGKTIALDGKRMQVIGIADSTEKKSQPKAYFPLYMLSSDYFVQSPPKARLMVNQVEKTSQYKDTLSSWLDKNKTGGANAHIIITNDFRLEQLSKGILVFKIIMGMITGIAVLVGGIGVMNVLLMSINERTNEIGIRKAIGAKRKAIAFQFLVESLMISLAGCFLGLLLGLGFMAVAIPIVRHFTEVPFSAALSGGSAVTVLAIAVVIGITFGTYPAWKASRLTPVDAIRRT